MLTRKPPGGYLEVRTEESPRASLQLENEGYAVVRRAFPKREMTKLSKEIESIYDSLLPDNRGANKLLGVAEHFRYEMVNRSALAQEVVGSRAILDVIEPLLGEDCHLIANTCWRNPPNGAAHGGGAWHIDGGPHVPLAPGQVWPEDIPHPVFAIGVHIFMQDCPMACGPTGVIPGSHKSGLPPPHDRPFDVDLTYRNQGVQVVTANKGDIALFVSDVWHRRMPPTKDDAGRFFLQAHYGRRDIAQRLKPTSMVHHLEPAALGRISSEREAHLLGLHGMGFYDG